MKLQGMRYMILALFTTTALVFLIPQTQSYQRLQDGLHHYAQSLQKGTTKEDNFDNAKWFFQLDVPWYELPDFQNVSNAPRNWRGPNHETFATFYASRNASMSDPYFIAAQQIVYRVLWDPRSRSKHSMTVFVAPFVSEEQRAYFTAAGAVVRELALRPFVPEHAGTAGRLRDMFSKLEMWNETDFAKIAYLDSDAFPLVNVDDIFKIAKEQDCRLDLVPAIDNSPDICHYTFAGYPDLAGVNAGVLVFNPNEHMYRRLVRESLERSTFDNGFMEQALLNLAYSAEGPFPPSYLPHSYNGGVDVREHNETLKIVHHKLWSTGFDAEDAWHKNEFNQTWLAMLDMYRSDEWKATRAADQLLTTEWD